MRTSSALFLLLGLVAACDAAPLAAQEVDTRTRGRVDSVFARYDHTDTPGCAVLVQRDGRTAYAHGYGLASLELGVGITPQTVMDIGSTSKQFTAAAIWLLAQDGKLSLDDEVQRYLPELPRLAGPVTLRHLLQHTSGWRDYVDLLALAGAQDEEVTTAADAMAALERQHSGNFTPGSWWTYSNSGFFLLGQVVERVSGTTMRSFLRDRIFAPLEMTHTDLFDDHARVYRGKASSYAPGDDGWRIVTANWEQTGDGAVQTSVEDLAKWDANFDAPVVGGRALVDSLQRGPGGWWTERRSPTPTGSSSTATEACAACPTTVHGPASARSRCASPTSEWPCT
jgi:CubicO group peptidase (beta-lactamase class C family)